MVRRFLLPLFLLAACNSDDDGEKGDSSGGGGDETVDADGDGYGAGTDCDDSSSAVYPGADEVCDGLDNDCDDAVDEDPVDGEAFWADEDGDGFGDAGAEVVACELPDGFASNADDCDDAEVAVNPDAAEVCDGVDNDCDALVDDADDSVDGGTFTTWWVDGDGDGFGDPLVDSVGACADPSVDDASYVDNDGDCDDLEPGVNPDATEVCDDADTDEDCDGLSDDADESVDLTDGSDWYADADADTYGDAATTTRACDDPSDGVSLWVLDATDCDDAAAGTNPGATEVCDAADTDEDCDGAADDADTSVDTSTYTTWHADQDSDGYGSPDLTQDQCDAPTGGGRTWLADGTDCDDADSGVNPGVTEVCDAADTDEDCSGAADDADSGVDPSTQSTFYADTDSDTYGDASVTAQACDGVSGYVSDATDCDDTDSAVNPAATEVCDDADTDEDCSGAADDADSGVDLSTASDWYEDADLDGYGDDSGTATQACDDPSSGGTVYIDDNTDCDDSDTDVNPGASEWYGDGVDQTCDGEDAPEFSCSGWTVPGDYSSIAAASAALGNSATVQTICLSARTYSENVTIRGNLNVIGPSAYDTTISGRVTVVSNRSSATVKLQGVTVTNGILVDGGASSANWTTTITDCIIEETNNHNIHVLRDGYGTPNTTIQRNIIEVKGASAGAYLYDYGYNTTDRVNFTVRDNYITGGSWGIRTAITKSSSRRTLQTVNIIGNTIEDGSYGLWLIGRGTSPNRVLNNLFTSNTRAYHWDGSGSLTSDYNLFYGNSTNFSGSASGGSNRVTSDPSLSADVPPIPASGGSADQAGTTSYASSTDFWTNPRPSPPSIGAVEPQ